jgi:hypothetical protein
MEFQAGSIIMQQSLLSTSIRTLLLFRFSSASPSDNKIDYEKEWEKSSVTVDKFDQILIDLRKLGFSFVTGLIAAGTVFQLGLNVQNGIIQATFALIAVLYWLDTYYQNVLVGAFLRAQFLEIFRLNYATNYYIGGIYNKAEIDSFITIIYLGLLIASGLIGFSINIITDEDNRSKQASNLEYSTQNASISKTLKLESSLTQTNENKSDSISIQDRYLLPVLKATTGSILNILGMIIFFGAIAIIVIVHTYGVRKKTISQQVIEVYNYFSRLIYEHKERVKIEIDDIEFFVNRILYGDLERNMYIEEITIHGKRLSDSTLAKVSTILLLKAKPTFLKSDRTTYSHWAIISKFGILLLKISRGKKSLSYFKEQVYHDTFERLNIDPKEVDRVRYSYLRIKIFDIL